MRLFTPRKGVAEKGRVCVCDSVCVWICGVWGIVGDWDWVVVMVVVVAVVGRTDGRVDDDAIDGRVRREEYVRVADVGIVAGACGVGLGLLVSVRRLDSWSNTPRELRTRCMSRGRDGSTRRRG